MSVAQIKNFKKAISGDLLIQKQIINLSNIDLSKEAINKFYDFYHENKIVTRLKT